MLVVRATQHPAQPSKAPTYLLLMNSTRPLHALYLQNPHSTPFPEEETHAARGQVTSPRLQLVNGESESLLIAVVGISHWMGLL